jgi:hypothetical protein
MFFENGFFRAISHREWFSQGNIPSRMDFSGQYRIEGEARDVRRDEKVHFEEKYMNDCMFIEH